MYKATRAPLELLAMLTYRRPAGSATEREFRERFLLPLGVKEDKAGNLVMRIGTAPIVWSCHTDTVHRHSGRQNVRIDGEWIKVANKQPKSNCLGADDTVGVWLMSELIRNRVEGLYLFHWGEEIGGIGSEYIATKTPELVDGIRCAIALDRKGRDSVITMQGKRCASNAFATALGEAIGLGMKPDSTGLFTDTANYTELIPECTNLSVGYDLAHTASERTHIGFACDLRDALLDADLTALPIVRDPNELPDYGFSWDATGWDDDRFAAFDKRLADATRKPTYGGAGNAHRRLVKLCESMPELVADVLEHHGIDADEIESWLV